MPKVELIFDTDCPNVNSARGQIRQALTDAGLPLHWDEWNRSNPAAPPYARQYGSPTILVGGRDVAGASASEGAACCRLYPDKNGRFQGVPTVEAVASAIQGDIDNGNKSGGGRAWLSIAPAVGVSLLPKLVCPACWPAYAGLLSAFGLGFLADTTYLLPLTALFFVVAVGALGWRAKNRRGYLPFMFGVAAAFVVIVGKFIFESDPALYCGIALLVGASLWNSWPKTITQPRPACCSTEILHQSSKEVSNG